MNINELRWVWHARPNAVERGWSASRNISLQVVAVHQEGFLVTLAQHSFLSKALVGEHTGRAFVFLVGYGHDPDSPL